MGLHRVPEGFDVGQDVAPFLSDQLAQSRSKKIPREYVVGVLGSSAFKSAIFETSFNMPFKGMPEFFIAGIPRLRPRRNLIQWIAGGESDLEYHEGHVFSHEEASGKLYNIDDSPGNVMLSMQERLRGPRGGLVMYILNDAFDSQTLAPRVEILYKGQEESLSPGGS